MTQEGSDYRLSEFRYSDGTTRILYLWDQTLRPSAQSEDSNSERAEEESDAGAEQEVRRAPEGFTLGVEFNAEQINQELMAPDVKLGPPDATSFPRTTEIMRAVTYAVNKAIELQMPLVINLSFGNTYGAHDGSSLLERFLDNA